MTDAMSDRTGTGAPPGGGGPGGEPPDDVAEAGGRNGPWRAYRHVARQIWIYRGSISLGLIVGLLILGSDQFAEVIRVMVERADTHERGLSLSGLTENLWLYVPIQVAALLPAYLRLLAKGLYAARGNGDRIPAPGLLVALICGLPHLALLLRLWELTQDPTIQGVALWYIIGVLVVYVAAMEWVLYRTDPDEALKISASIGGLLLIPAFAVFFWPVQIGAFLGPISLTALFAACLASLATVASWLEDERRVPVTLALAIAIVVFSAFDLNDNHAIRTREAALPVFAEPAPRDATKSLSRAEAAPYTEIERRFLAWLDCRPDYPAAFDPADPPPYTVYLVAAQGGGLYAAYQSAHFLALAEDEYPGFAGKVFAISAVSGGAVGAGIFASLLRDTPSRSADPDARCGHSLARTPREDGHYASLTRQILGQDHLSPVGAAMLFPDLAARLSPVPIPAADRARALERSFERAYATALGRDWDDAADFGLTVPVSAHWDPGADAPLLLLNTTDVSTGTRMIASSPLAGFPRERVATARRLLGCPEDGTCAMPRLSTAMILSARFPIVTPAGTVPLLPCTGAAEEDKTYCDPGGDRRRPKARFVDGGYFENSGLDTLGDLIEGLDRVRRERRVSFTVIAFDLPAKPIPNRSYGIGELMSPLRALNAARSARTFPARQRVGTLPGTLLLPVSLDDRNEAYTLGWLLSDRTLDRIERDLYDAEVCDAPRSVNGKGPDPAPPLTDEERVERLVREANCGVWRNIRSDLQIEYRTISRAR